VNLTPANTIHSAGEKQGGYVDRFDAMRVFVRVAEKGSFSAVAKERGIGQPAVSKQISALEDELGTELIHRTSRSMQKTRISEITNKILDIVRLLSSSFAMMLGAHMDTDVPSKASNKQEVRHVRRTGILSLAVLAFGVSAYGQTQSTTTPNEAASQPAVQKQGRSAGGDIGSGSGDIGTGAGKGAGNLAKGAGKGAGDLVTLHPVDAAGAVGKGGASAGKNVAVGTAKGTGKIVKGTGKVLKKPF
jgi:molybdenum-dependent DNA-binding transcriptional regulator ModE